MQIMYARKKERMYQRDHIQSKIFLAGPINSLRNHNEMCISGHADCRFLLYNYVKAQIKIRVSLIAFPRVSRSLGISKLLLDIESK